MSILFSLLICSILAITPMNRDASTSISTVNSTSNAMALDDSSSNYNSSSVETHAHRRLIIILQESACLILLLVVGLQAYHIQKNKIRKDTAIIKDVKEDLRKQKLHNEQISKTIEDGISHKVTILAQLSDAFFQMDEDFITDYESHNGRVSKEEITRIFRRVLESLRDKEDTIILLEDALNTTENNLMTRVRSDYPELKEQDFSFLTLFFSGFSTKSIAFMMAVSEPAVRMRKSRLKHLFTHSQMGDNTEYSERLS